MSSTPASSDATPASAAPEPPALPTALLAPWPVIVVIATGFLVAVILAFAVPALRDWRPTAVAGQRAAYRRGARGAQSGFADIDRTGPGSSRPAR